ncbi:hypothetical protein [Streptomyces pratensis]|uniref:hypothetical protein n=1 Tax=Streptomyces pratensis TaxID=1169025 RepID=UPI001933461E|nr:hypothetical protein [Streptomyces pratensis]
MVTEEPASRALHTRTTGTGLFDDCVTQAGSPGAQTVMAHRNRPGGRLHGHITRGDRLDGWRRGGGVPARPTCFP